MQEKYVIKSAECRIQNAELLKSYGRVARKDPDAGGGGVENYRGILKGNRDILVLKSQEQAKVTG